VDASDPDPTSRATSHPLLKRILQAFSPRQNLRLLFERPRERFAPLDGVRGLFTLWVIAAHCLFWFGVRRFRAAVELEPPLRLILLAHYAIDAFFVMSGFLLAHLLMSEKERTGRFDVGRFLVRRAARILPAYYLAIALYAVLGSDNRERFVYNVLYVNNFLPAGQQFMLWTWSLAVEEQFYLTLPCVLLLAYGTKHFRGAFLLGIIVIAAFVRLILVDANGFGAPGVSPLSQGLAIVDTLYTKTYGRFGSLACGVFVAYLLQHRPKLLATLDRSPRATLALTLGSLACIALVCLPDAPSDMPFFQFGHAWPAWLVPSALALNRVAFALAFSCLMTLMLGTSKLGRLLGSGLSFGLWYPFAQLSYAAYLFHPLVIQALPRPSSITYSSLSLLFAETCALTYAVALLVHLAVERPCMNLRRAWRPAAPPA
jgi:peptidoglycan/LPS O-acetylase OafA/YrhL